MLEIRPIMNSSVEEILGFKTCCGLRVFDQNLEIHVTNRGERPVRVYSRLDLRGESGVFRVDNLMPGGLREIAPGEIVAFYCTMDENRWAKAREVVFFDTEGNEHRTQIVPAQGEGR